MTATTTMIPGIPKRPPIPAPRHQPVGPDDHYHHHRRRFAPPGRVFQGGRPLSAGLNQYNYIPHLYR